MLVSHRKKFIYTKTAKTAGTSVESYFEQFCMPEGEWTPEHNRDIHVSEAGIIGFRGTNRPKDTDWFNHMSATRIKSQIGDEIWSSYLKFCVVRDPFDKAVSAFYHHYNDREASRTQPAGKSWKQRIKGLLRPEPEFDTISGEFEHWLKTGGLVLDRDKYMIDDAFCLDEVIRYENLHEDMRKICGKIGVEFDPARLPQFKAGIRDEKVGLAEIYTPKAVKIVSDLYDYEVERFGYQPPVLK